MKKFNLSSLDESRLEELCRRPAIDFARIFDEVRPVIEQVRRDGDRAVLDLTEKFDRVRQSSLTMPVRSPDQIPVDEETRRAFSLAYDNIFKFHKAQYPRNLRVETMRGVLCRRVAMPVEKAGLYIPGGSAILPSTLLMLGIPAKIAGCSEVIVATPPDRDGNIAPEIELAASMAGVTSIVKAGGAQAIAAMAYGTESVPKVDKIFGPGNAWVTAAKMLLQNSDAVVAIDLPAGPSEVLVIADQTADPAFVASDLLSQAEHGPDSQVVLVAVGETDISAVEREIEKQLEMLPRAETARRALESSFIIHAETAEQAMQFSNRYAPEHLIINCRSAEKLSGKVRHAGSVFIGPWSPESVGDYASGTNHTLPTHGYARMYSGVSLDSFFRHITMQRLTKEGLRNIGPAVCKLAEIESLKAHENAVTIRLEKLKESVRI